MLEIVFDRLVRLMTTSLAQFHLGQCGSQPGQHHLHPLRRLSEFDPAARDPGRVPRRATRQLRPVHGGFQPHLFHRRRASGRTARLLGHAHRGPALHHHRAHAGPAHDRGDPAGHVARPSSRWRRSISSSTGWRPIRASRPSRARPTRPSWSSCASTWKTAAGAPNCCLPYATLEPIRKLLLQQFMGEKFGRDSIWESHLATELWSTKVEIDAILDEQIMPLNKIMNLEVGQTVMLNATSRFQDRAALPRRAAAARPHGTRRLLRRRARRRSHRTHRRLARALGDNDHDTLLRPRNRP